MKNSREEILILFLCLLAGFLLRFYTFDQKSFWVDEIHTYNDSRDAFKEQIKFYKENPNYLHPPLFFVLTHVFYPFTKPERDLRIIPLISGTLSLPMIYFLAKLFSPSIALPSMISLAFMAYHVSLSQDGRSYALLMFLAMASLYFFLRHLDTRKIRHLITVGILFAALFYTSYSSIPFIALSQILWLYKRTPQGEKSRLSSFLVLNALVILLCLPWILFIGLNFQAQPIMDPLHDENPGSLGSIMYGVLHDWVPYAPLMITSVILLILFPFLSKNRRNAFLILAIFVLPVAGLYLFCRFLNITHFFTSRYFINFLPIFLISLYLSLDAIEIRFAGMRRFMRLRFLFVVLFVASNLAILPLYYRSEKEDIRGLVTYLKNHLKQGDKIFVETLGYIPGILHYMGNYPEGRHHLIPFWSVPQGIEYRKSFFYRGQQFWIYYSSACCAQYVAEGNRLWIVASKWGVDRIKGKSPCVLKGYFDGSFLNFSRFPTDASLYLFLWDPRSPDEKGIDMPIE